MNINIREITTIPTLMRWRAEVIENVFGEPPSKNLQFKFFEQWNRLKAYANERHIQIVGDMPIYVSPDGADVWAHSELFQLDGRNVPTAIAGCPPDAFAADGQIWGNPLYRWDYHRNTGYDWWVSRLWFSFQMFDLVRIDHFRGFDA